MQFSNGLTNSLGLWLGHILFDGMFCLFAATVIVVIFAATTNQFHGLGYFVSSLSLLYAHFINNQWLVIFLYGICGALFAYLGTIITKSALAAFALVAGYQVIMFVVGESSRFHSSEMTERPVILGWVSFNLDLCQDEQVERDHSNYSYVTFTLIRFMSVLSVLQIIRFPLHLLLQV